jgi:putative glutamine amidotransferase
MRLVSALYDDFGPFPLLNSVKSMDVVSEVKELSSEDILIVHGGADIHPSLYNKGRSSKSGAYGNGPSNRDKIEWALMQAAADIGVPIIGICRGAQMLCALNGGYLIQDVHGHSGTHTVHTKEGNILTNSIHHQMMVPTGKFELEGWTVPHSKSYMDVDEEGNDVKLDVHPLGLDPEFVYFPEIKGFAIQWHPEMMKSNTPASKFLINYINHHV